MELIHHYHSDPALRASFNALAEATFGMNFENWYQNGFWGDNYTPYSIVEEGKIVANVSLNRTDLLIGGEPRRLYQLGTVMTDPACRNRGYIRAIMAEVEKVTADADGIYLFANDSVLDFYPKFGFQKAEEWIYSKPIIPGPECTMVQIPMDGPAAWKKLQTAMEENRFPACRMVDNAGLIFFYVSQFLQNCVYFCEEHNAWAIAEAEDGNLLLHDVFSPDENLSLDSLAAAFGPRFHTLTLGFTPTGPESYSCRPHKEEDCTFFVKGPIWQEFASRSMRIPTLAHA